jgi:Na+-driven multidrug efflux pump
LKNSLLKAFFVGLIVFIIGLFFSVNLGEFLDAGSIENARAYIIAMSVLFLSGVVSASTYLILHEIRNKK